MDAAGKGELRNLFVKPQQAVNVLKLGRGRSYVSLVAVAATLPFRVKLPDEAFFHEGDVSEISTLIEVDDKFVLSMTEVLLQLLATSKHLERGYGLRVLRSLLVTNSLPGRRI